MRYAVTAIIAIVVGFALAVLWRRNPIKQIANEFRAIDEAAATARRVAEIGADEARASVEIRYADTLKKLDRQHLAHARWLRGDPVALSRWLARIGKQ